MMIGKSFFFQCTYSVSLVSLRNAKKASYELMPGVLPSLL